MFGRVESFLSGFSFLRGWLGRVKRLDGVCVFAGQGVFWLLGGFVVVGVGAFVLVRAFFVFCLWECLGWCL